MNDNFDFHIPKPAPQTKKTRRGIPTGIFLAVTVFLLVVTALLTSVFVSRYQKKRYTNQLNAQQSKISELNKTIEQLRTNGYTDPERDGIYAAVETLDRVFRQYSYYANEFDEEALLTAVMKAYATATGDNYAEYFTAEEYAELERDSQGDQEGIGVSVINSTETVSGIEQPVFYVLQAYQNSPAEKAGILPGDCLYAVKVDEAFRSITELGGYTKAINSIRGKAGTDVTIKFYRKKTDGTFADMTVTMTRAKYVSRSVSYEFATNDPATAIIHLMEFDLTTPGQFKECISAAQKDGATRFVMDLRNNPGGDLKSIQAVMTYFLPAGSVILRTVDRNGNAGQTYYSEVMYSTGQYASCNVSLDEIGMYADLDMVVLCNQNTASAAEVFVANMQDYHIAPVIGTVTFGKGIMQTFLPLAYFGNYSGYAKMTTYAICTKRPQSYHGIGITPDVVKELSPEAQSYSIYLLPQELDDQLIEAMKHFKK